MKSARTSLLPQFAGGCVLLFASAVAHADSQALDPVSIWLGGYYANTEVNLDAKTRDGNLSTGKIQLEEGDDTVGRARLDVLLFGSQGLEFDYYTLSHSSTDTLAQPFSFLGVPFDVNSTVRGKTDFSAGSAAYHWWFGADEDVFGVGLGAAYFKVKFKVEGSVSVNDQTTSGSASWDQDAVAPLLTVAWKHAFSDALRIYVDGSGVYKNGGTLSGHIYDARGGVEWFPWHNVGLAAEYGVSRIKLERESGLYDANLDIKLHGPSLFARFRF